MRKQIVKENLEIDKIIVPFVSTENPSVEYSTAYFQMGEEYEYEKNVKSMFTVVEDDKADSVNNLDDYDDDDDYFD